VRDLEDGPQSLVFLFAVCAGVLGVAHLVAVGEECVFYVVEAGRGWLFAFSRADGWHGCVLCALERVSAGQELVVRRDE